MFAETTLWHGAWTLSAFWAWIFAIGLSCALATIVLHECAVPAGAFTIILIGFAHLIGVLDVGALLSNPLLLLLWVLPYLVCGLVFCFYRYRYWLRSKIAKGMQTYQNTTADKVASGYTPKEQIERLTIWILWWPICLLRLMLGDWLQSLVRFVVIDVFGKFFQSIWQAEVERAKGK